MSQRSVRLPDRFHISVGDGCDRERSRSPQPTSGADLPPRPTERVVGPLIFAGSCILATITTGSMIYVARHGSSTLTPEVRSARPHPIDENQQVGGRGARKPQRSQAR